MHMGEGGAAGIRDQRKTAPHLGHQGPAAAGVLCSVAVQAQVGGGDVWAWGKGWGAVGAELSSPRRKLLLDEEAGGTARSLLLL